MNHYQLELTDPKGHIQIVSAYGENLAEAIQSGVAWKGSEIVSRNGKKVTIAPAPLRHERLEISILSVRKIKE